MNDTKKKVKEVKSQQQEQEVWGPSVVEELLELLADKEEYRP